MNFNQKNYNIETIIEDYLTKHNLTLSLKYFQIETQNNNFQKGSNKSNEILKAYDNGQYDLFFQLFYNIIPKNNLISNKNLSKLEFFLHVYFSIYPILRNIIDKKEVNDKVILSLKEKMIQFKAFLDQKETDMLNTNDLLPYYALPYISNPVKHPTFQKIFKVEWYLDLKEKLMNALKDYDVVEKNSLLESIIQNNQSMTEELNRYKSLEEISKKTLIDCQIKWSKLSLEIIRQSSELCNLLDKLKSKHDEFNKALIVKEKIKKYEKFINNNLEELKLSTSTMPKDQKELKEHKEHKELIIKESIDSIQNKQIMKEKEATVPFTIRQNEVNQSIDNKIIDYDISLLNYFKIKENFIKHINLDFENTNEEHKLKSVINLNFALREIRCRLTRKKIFELKQFALYGIIYYDLFEIRPNSSLLLKKTNIYSYIINEPTLIVESLKLINSLCNEPKGRNYLLERDTFIDDIVRIMKKEKYESEIRQNCLGIVQKLTLKSSPQAKLIDLNIIHWIVLVLIEDKDDGLTEYTLEYGLALLMNLSLKKLGRDKCEELAKPILSLLIYYLNSDSVQIRTCVNGTLYSLIKRKSIREIAKSYKLLDTLETLIENPNDQMKKQIQYIIDELNSNDDLEEIDEDDNKAENEDEEDELIDEEYVSFIIFNYLDGRRLLK